MFKESKRNVTRPEILPRMKILGTVLAGIPVTSAKAVLPVARYSGFMKESYRVVRVANHKSGEAISSPAQQGGLVAAPRVYPYIKSVIPIPGRSF
uniref:Uncharacterized protein n=1 Tax=Vespula pensylvanica TaxID=30213 RepID=A0A834UGB6_VESPE|nr:hypothetical protein H0235_000333 [Vespula pensylvanica]